MAWLHERNNSWNRHTQSSLGGIELEMRALRFVELLVMAGLVTSVMSAADDSPGRYPPSEAE
jgi:hypothetical protein